MDKHFLGNVSNSGHGCLRRRPLTWPYLSQEIEIENIFRTVSQFHQKQEFIHCAEKSCVANMGPNHMMIT